MGENLASLLIESAARSPEATAIRLGELELGYGQLDDASARLATVLRQRGVQPGDRVGVMLPNVPQFPVAYYGALRAGATVVPMNVLLKRREIAFYLEDSGARLLLAWHGFAEEARGGAEDAGAEPIEVEPASFAELLSGSEPTPAVAEVADDDTAVILYTSGTTGKPKGAELTHANLRRNVEAVLELFSIERDDVILGALPLFHSFGQTCALNAAVAADARLALMPRFAPGEALELIERERVTVFEGVPTMYSALLNHPERERFDVSSLRLCVSGGAALPL